jgi:hypothetical protein
MQYAIALRLATVCVTSADDCSDIRKKLMDMEHGVTLADLMEAGITIQELNVERVQVFCPDSGEWIEDKEDCPKCGKPKEADDG